MDYPQCEIIYANKLINTTLFKEAILELNFSTSNFADEDFEDTERAATSSYPDSEADLIASKCAVIREFKENGLHGNEPCWYFAMGVVRHCIDGIDKCHEFSSQDEDYKEAEATTKINQLVKSDVGPTLCETFRQFGMCDKCKHKIVTPVQLGIFSEQVPVDEFLEKDDGRAEQLIKLAPIGKTWIINKRGIYRTVDGESALVCDIPFYVTDLICEDFSDESVLTAVITTFPTDKRGISFKLPFKLLSEPAKMMAEFYGRSVFPIKKHVKDYLIAYFNNLRHIVPHRTINSLGWQCDDSFVYNSSGDGISAKNKKVMCVLDKKMVGFAQGFESKGTIEGWQSGFALYTQDKAFMPYIFSVLCSLGSPLLTFTTAKGCVLSLQGTSGSGKTLSHKYAMSVWGDPETAGILSTIDSLPARAGRMSVAKNLPVRFDEITNMPPARLSGLIYELVNGRGRSRSTIDGSLSSTAAKWQTVTLVTTNRPLLDNAVCVLSEAERCRILELEASMPPNIIEIGKSMDVIMHKNYGVVGPLFMQHVLRNKEKVIDIISKYYDTFQYELKEDKRFWATCGAVAFTAAVIANHLKLIEIDVGACINWFLKTLQQQTDIQQKSIIENRGFESREEFISALRDSMNNAILRIGEDGLPQNELNQPVKGRLVTENKQNSLYVRTDIFKDFVRAHYKISVERVRRDLGIAKSIVKRFGSDVIRCYELETKL